MTMYRKGIDRIRKYEAKFNPTVISTRFSDVRDLAIERAQDGLITMASVDDLVRPILDKYGVAGPDRAKYLGFAKKLFKHASRASGEAATKIASGLKSYFVTAYGCDPAILDEIINVVTGYVTPY